MEQSLYDQYGGFEKAQSILFDVLKRNPKDKVAWHHLIKATQCLEEGVSENWRG